MVQLVPASAPGVLAFVISGRLTRADYQDVLLPPIRDTIARRESIRVLAAIESFEGMEPGGLLEELKAAGKLGSSQDALRSYFAVVTDIGWVRRSVTLFGWIVPGELRVFTTAKRPDAEAWLANAA
jgi:hypothetical protein